MNFEELLGAVFKGATSRDIAAMVEMVRFPFSKFMEASSSMELPQVEAEVAQQAKRQNRLSRDQLEQLRKIFDLYDLDGSGEISVAELEEGLRRSRVFSKDDILSTFK